MCSAAGIPKRTVGTNKKNPAIKLRAAKVVKMNPPVCDFEKYIAKQKDKT